MGGHRKKTGAPLDPVKTRANQRATFAERQAAAKTVGQELGAVTSFAQSVLADQPPAVARRVADELIAHTYRTVDALPVITQGRSTP